MKKTKKAKKAGRANAISQAAKKHAVGLKRRGGAVSRSALKERRGKKARKTSHRRSRKGAAGKRAAPAAVADRAAGFDCGSYPGDKAISAWAANSEYAFVSFYFDAPCHTTSTFKSWSGKFPMIKSAGLGLAVIYVGFQQGTKCGNTRLSRKQGIAHGQDAVAKFTIEGFPAGTIVFLDVEHYAGSLAAGFEAYIRGWLSALLDDGSAGPGIYCPDSKANEILLAAQKEYASHGFLGAQPRFWIVKIEPGFNPTTSIPTDCGVSFANIWQGVLDTQEMHGGISIRVDQNVADSRDPSGALRQVMVV